MTDSDDFVPNIYVFDDATATLGEKVKDLDDDASYVRYFSLLFDRGLMDIIVSVTNKYFMTSGGDDGASPFSPARQWKDTDVEEM